MDKDSVLLFFHVVRRMSREVRRTLKIPVMGPQVELLELLEKRGPLKMSDLAGELDISLGAVTSLADRMTRAGLIMRERTTADRRVILLVLTSEGEKTLSDIAQARGAVMRKYFGKLTETEMTQLESMCRKMLQP